MSKREKKPVTGTDEVEIALGRKPKVPFAVASRCPDGTLQVLKAHPIYWEENRWKPFPTYFWLVCPRLKKRISQFEQAGYISKARDRLKNETAFFAAFIEGQKAVVKDRLEMARKITDDKIPDQVQEVLEHTTISGSRDPMGVKCLHAHVAQALTLGQNPIGDWILEHTGKCRKQVPCRDGDSSDTQEKSL